MGLGRLNRKLLFRTGIAATVFAVVGAISVVWLAMLNVNGAVSSSVGSEVDQMFYFPIPLMIVGWLLWSATSCRQSLSNTLFAIFQIASSVLVIRGLIEARHVLF